MIFTPEELFHISLAYHFVRRTYLKGTSPWDLILSKPGKFVNPMNGLNTSAATIVEKYKSLPPMVASVEGTEESAGKTAVEPAGQSQFGQSQFDETMQEFITRWGMLAHYNRMISLSKDPDYILFLQLRDETMRWLVNTVKSAMKTTKAAETTPQTASRTAAGTSLSDKSKSLLARLDRVIWLCGTATEMNETDFSIEVKQLLKEVGLYKSQWDLRSNLPEKPIQIDEETHNLMIAIIAKLKGIPDGGAELFPFELIDTLGQVYGLDTEKIEADEPMSDREILRKVSRLRKR